MTSWSKSSVVGAGISLRPEHHASILSVDRQVDWLEIQPENYMRQGPLPRRSLDACRERWSIVPHGVSLSLGGMAALSEDYLERASRLCSDLDAPYFSEHASFASAPGMAFHELIPVPFTEAMADHLAGRIIEAGKRLERPMVIENITYYATLPDSTMTEGAFLSRVLEISGAGLLLDLNNVYVNAKNHGLSPDEVLAALPLSQTAQIHLAGHTREGNLLLDDHGAAVPDQVWSLYRSVLQRLGPIPTLIEWENGLPSVDRVLDEADKARAILHSLTPSHRTERSVAP